jgi:hypothetical protein
VRDGIVGVAEGVDDGEAAVGVGACVTGLLVVADPAWLVVTGAWDPRPLVVVEHPVEAVMMTVAARTSTV